MNEFNYNKDIKKRDTIIFGEYNPRLYGGGIRCFYDLSINQLKELIENNFIDLKECHNDAPPVSVFYNFMQKYPNYIASGYVVSIDREDYGTNLVGLNQNNGYKSRKELEEFHDLFRCADEFEVSKFNMSCWFD